MLRSLLQRSAQTIGNGASVAAQRGRIAASRCRSVSSHSRPPPVVALCHGLLGFQHAGLGRVSFPYWTSIERRLRARGFRLVHPVVPRAASIESRARALADQLPDCPVHIVAHSMGGLDARYFVSHLGGHRNTVSLTTLGTPHRGSSFADWCLELVGDRVHHHALNALRHVGVEADAFQQLTSAYLRDQFNPTTEDRPEVEYYSFAASRQLQHMSRALVPSGYVIHRREGPNDGLVSEASARWGKCVSVEADHLELIGWCASPFRNCYPAAEALDRHLTELTGWNVEEVS
mmetsp:Transcript_22515/g.72470  ORF Transcript_22515/g.72470 Transcript_22515/m.72470 type:complete len:290 (-) Transcript_22515:6-875(-)